MRCTTWWLAEQRFKNTTYGKRWRSTLKDSFEGLIEQANHTLRQSVASDKYTGGWKRITGTRVPVRIQAPPEAV